MKYDHSQIEKSSIPVTEHTMKYLCGVVGLLQKQKQETKM
jgi:hypothetical protein